MKQRVLTRWIALFLCFLTLFSSSASAATYEKIKRGDSGAEVAAMQGALKFLGFDIEPDGRYGYVTEKIVREFQKKWNLEADGVAGDQTLSLLYQLAPLFAPSYTGGGAAVTASPTPYANVPQTQTNRLERGSEGSAVIELQMMLAKIGYSIAADGKFGYATYLVVKSFQSKYGLTADGIAGAQTIALLRTLTGGTVTATASPTASPSPTPTAAPMITATPTQTIIANRLERGSEGSAVVELQMMLAKLGYSIAADGKFGYATYLVVKSFQSKYGLTADGIAGAQTIALLRSLTNITVTATPTVTPSPTPTAAPVVTPTAAPSSTTAQVTTTGGILYMRGTPSKSGSILERIPNGTLLPVIERGSIWCSVLYNGIAGYVMTSFLTFVTAQTPTNTPTDAPTVTPSPTPAAPAVSRRAQVTGGKLYLRSQPSRSGAILFTLPDGAYLTVLSEGATWTAVAYESYTGYVMTKYIIFVAEPTATPTPSPSPTPTNGVTPTATPAYDANVLNRVLTLGMTGSDVTIVQTRLKTLNYLADVTGTYDGATVTAVRAFQRIHGLSVDGVAGKQTFTLLFSSDASPYSDAAEGYSTLHIYYQSADPDLKDDIERMQARLSALGYTANVTGKFDETTYMAVLAFQLRNGLTVDGVGSIAMQNKLFSSSANPASAAPSYALEDGAGIISSPAASSIKLLHWFNDIKPSLAAGAHLLIYDPSSGRSWTLRLYAAGNHADSEPLTLRDTLIMNEAFGKPSWTTHPVYVQLPNGQWTIASMHNHPHLTGSIKANGFDGHLCVHFLRDMTECQKNDPNYGVSNQKTIRSLWYRLTGETIAD